MRRGGFHALFLESCWSHEAKKRWLFLSHDAAPHFETLPHRNSQQNKERRYWSALKNASRDVIPWTSGAPGTFTTADEKIARVYVDTLSVPPHADGVSYCCFCFREIISRRVSQSRPWLVGYGVLLEITHVTFCRGADFCVNNIRIWRHPWLPLSRELSWD